MKNFWKVQKIVFQFFKSLFNKKNVKNRKIDNFSLFIIKFIFLKNY